MTGDFLIDDGGEAPHSFRSSSPSWRVLVVDDEPDVHAITRMVLSGVTYKGRAVELLSAYSSAEALSVLEQETDIAVVLLDVVMETSDAGLRCVEAIRDRLGNRLVRIVLRTGQPGQVPEREIILRYDVSDYKAKSELSASRLHVCLISAIRWFDDLVAAEQNRQLLKHYTTGLEAALARLAPVLGKTYAHAYAGAMLEGLVHVLRLPVVGLVCTHAEVPVGQRQTAGEMRVLAANGRFAGEINRPVRDCAHKVATLAINATLGGRRGQAIDDWFTVYLRTPAGRELVVFAEAGRGLTQIEMTLAEVYCGTATAGLDSVYGQERMRRAGKAMVVALADLAERSEGRVGRKVLRIGRLTDEIARALSRAGHYREELQPLMRNQVGVASILHDVGKVTVPEHILAKPGRLDAAEWEAVKHHSRAGGSILDRARRAVRGSAQIDLGAEIARHHHERFDGSGYPDGLAGTKIPLAARIVAVADVFDALTSERPYKQAWPEEEAIAVIRDGAGSAFDPLVVEAFLAVMADRSQVRVLEWTPAMSVGDPVMDADHRGLVRLINQLAGVAGSGGGAASADAGGGGGTGTGAGSGTGTGTGTGVEGGRGDESDVLEEVLDELLTYALDHFSREEEYLARAGYPGLEDHRSRHEELTRRVLDIHARFTAGFRIGVGAELAAVLTDWLRTHILEEDMAYSRFLEERRGERR